MTDLSDDSSPLEDDPTVTPIPPDNIVITPDKTNCSLPYVHIVNRETGELVGRFLAYPESFRGGVRVATGDVTGDGVPEIITAPGRGYEPWIRVFNQSGVMLTEFLAFASSFTYGVDVAVGDVDGDGLNDIAAAQSYNGSQVVLFRNTGSSFVHYKSEFYPFGSTFKGGATVELADMGTFSNGTVVNGSTPDGKAEIVVGNEAGMSPTVRVFDYTGSSAKVVRTFNPFTPTFQGGLSLDAARVDGDLIPDIIVGTGNGGGSNVEVDNGISGALVLSAFNAYSSATTLSSNAPVRLAAVDQDGDGRTDIIVTGQGTDGTTRKIRSFDPLSGEPKGEFVESHPDFCGAYFVADFLSTPPNATVASGSPLRAMVSLSSSTLARPARL